jgi:cell division protein ZapE
VRLLCLDEFVVTDITDAMILHGLLRAFFARGITLVTTSNIPPDELYRNGLQRERFLPAIGLLQEHAEVFNLDGGTDYRLRALQQAEIYFTPLDEAAEAGLAGHFANLSGGHEEATTSLAINHREIPVRRLAPGVAWFDFAAVCDGPRATADYIEIAREYHTVLISGVPQLTPARDAAARRLLHLVDEFYDRNVKLIVSGATPVENLYQGDALAFEYQRLHSRLTEMQSVAYLARPHLPL